MVHLKKKKKQRKTLRKIRVYQTLLMRRLTEASLATAVAAAAATAAAAADATAAV